MSLPAPQILLPPAELVFSVESPREEAGMRRMGYPV